MPTVQSFPFNSTYTVSKSLGWFNVMDYGATGNGVNDDTVAIQATINAASAAGGGLVYIPPGTYLISSALIGAANVSLQGAAEAVSTIVANTAGMTCFEMIYAGPTFTTPVNMSISGLTFDSNGLANCTAINMTWAGRFTIRDVRVNGFLNNVYISTCNTFLMENCLASANATFTQTVGTWVFTTVSSSTFCYSGTLINVNSINAGNGTKPYGWTIYRCVGFVCYSCNINDMRTGNGASPGTGWYITGGCQGCAFYECGSGAGASAFSVGTGIDGAGPEFMNWYSCIMDQQTVYAFSATTGMHLGVYGCQITGYGVASSIGMLLQGVIDAIIAGNFFDGWSTASNVGINVSGTSSNILITDNMFSNCYYGIGLPGAAGSFLGLRVLNNMFAAPTFGEINGTFGPTGTTVLGVGSLIENNQGFTNALNSAPAFPASTTPVTNNCGFKVKVVISNGTGQITVVSINGVASGQTVAASGNGFVGVLSPGETIALTYAAGTPSWTWLPIN